MIKFLFGYAGLFVFLLALCICPGATLAEPQEQVANLYYNSAMWEYMEGITKAGDYAYCTMTYGMVIIDVNDPANPAFASQVFIEGAASVDVALNIGFAYVSSHSGLYKIDVSDPYNPKIVSVCENLAGSISNFIVTGDYLIFRNATQFRIYNISDPENAYQVYEYENDLIRGFCRYGDYIFVSTEGDGVIVFDMSDPENVTLSTHLDSIQVYSYGINIAGDYLFVGGSTSMSVYDISNFPEIENIGEVDTPYRADRIFVDGNYLVATGGYYYCDIYDITDPESPVWVGEYYFYESGYLDVNDVEYDSEYLYYSSACNPTRLNIIDLAEPASPHIMGYYDFESLGWAEGVAVKDNYVYVAADNAGLNIFDYSTQPYPTLIASFHDFSGDAINVVINVDYVYVSAQGAKIINISDPYNPVLVSSIALEVTPEDVFIRGNYAYYPCKSYGLRIVDISDPVNPVIVGTCDTPGDANDVTLLGNLALVADRNEGLQIMDITDPEAPYIIGNLPTPNWLESVENDGEYVYCGVDHNGLWVVDISDPVNPIVVSDYYNSHSFEDVHIAGDYLCMAQGTASGLRILDISDPLNPELVSHYVSPGFMLDVAAWGDKVFIADEFGLLIRNTTAPFVCGELNGDGAVNLFDVVFLIQYLYLSGQAPAVIEAADVNNSGNVDVFDITAMIAYLYLGGGGLSCP